MIQYGLGLSSSADLSYNLGSQSAIDGGSVPTPAVTSFTFTVDTTKPGSANNTFIFRTVSNGVYNCVIDYGDGSQSGTITTFNDGAWTKVYAAPGTYTWTITGACKGLRFAAAGDYRKFISVQRWGQFQLINNVSGGYFQGCTNLNLSTVLDTLDLSNITAATSMFNGCTSLTSVNNFDSWNFTGVTSFANFFRDCTSLNFAVNITLPNATTVSSMFRTNTSLNSTITINAPVCTNFLATLLGCTSLNKLITLTMPTTGSTITLESLVSGCTALTVMPVLNSTTKVSTFLSLFNNCTLLNPDVSNWNIASLTNATGMMTGSGFDITNYNKLLDSGTGWPSQGTIQNNVTAGFGTAHYSGANAIAGRAILVTTHTWTITDGGTP